MCASGLKLNSSSQWSTRSSVSSGPVLRPSRGMSRVCQAAMPVTTAQLAQLHLEAAAIGPLQTDQVSIPGTTVTYEVTRPADFDALLGWEGDLSDGKQQRFFILPSGLHREGAVPWTATMSRFIFTEVQGLGVQVGQILPSASRKKGSP